MADYKNMSTEEIKEALGFYIDEIVDPMRLAEKIEVDIFETSLDQKQDGFRIVCAIIKKDRPSVFYHKLLIDGQGTERVAITYALVHYVLCETENFMITHQTIMDEQEEMLIYELLMPQSLVADRLTHGASINDLANEFRVPKKCVRERLDAMPASIAISSNLQ